MTNIATLPDVEARGPRSRAAGVRALACSESVAVRNVRLRRVLERVAGAFNAGGVPLMVLKGGALLLTVYRPGERPMDDLDLLVRPEHFDEACRLLRAIGARLGRPLVREDFCPRFYYEREFLIGTVDPVKIDLHVRPFRPLPCAKLVPGDALWSGAREVAVGAAKVYLPNVEQMLIHLAAHAAFHGLSRRMWLQDIKLWTDAHRLQIDWRRVLDLVDRWRLVLPFRVALAAAARELGPVCPEEVPRRLSDRSVRWRDRLVLWQAPRDAQHPAAHVLVNLLCTPGVRFRFEYLRAVALPDQSHMRGRGAGGSRRATAQVHLARCLRPLCVKLSALPRRAAAGAKPALGPLMNGWKDWLSSQPSTAREGR